MVEQEEADIKATVVRQETEVGVSLEAKTVKKVANSSNPPSPRYGRAPNVFEKC